jgi:hypothetical protein
VKATNRYALTAKAVLTEHFRKADLAQAALHAAHHENHWHKEDRLLTVAVFIVGGVCIIVALAMFGH